MPRAHSPGAWRRDSRERGLVSWLEEVLEGDMIKGCWEGMVWTHKQACLAGVPMVRGTSSSGMRKTQNYAMGRHIEFQSDTCVHDLGKFSIFSFSEDLRSIFLVCFCFWWGFFFWLYWALCAILVPWPGNWTHSPGGGRTVLTTDVRSCSVPQLCPTLCNPMAFRPPGSSVHGISQARTLEWISVSFSRGSSWPRDPTCISCVNCIGSRFFTSEPPGKPLTTGSPGKSLGPWFLQL